MKCPHCGGSIAAPTHPPAAVRRWRARAEVMGREIEDLCEADEDLCAARQATIAKVRASLPEAGAVPRSALFLACRPSAAAKRLLASYDLPEGALVDVAVLHLQSIGAASLAQSEGRGRPAVLIGKGQES